MPILTRLHQRALSIALVLAASFVLTSSAWAQEKQYTGNQTDQALKSDARVDPSTFGMSLEIPLGGAPGRAGASVSSTIRYSSQQWRLKYAGGFQGNINYFTWTRPTFSENAMAGWTSSLDAPWIEYSGREQPFDDNGNPLSDDPQASYNTVCYVPRIHLHLPDGSSSELRKSDTPDCVPLGYPTPAFTGTFYSTDNTRMRFDADNGVLYLVDGGRYFFGAEQTVQRYNNLNVTGRWAVADGWKLIPNTINVATRETAGMQTAINRKWLIRAPTTMLTRPVLLLLIRTAAGASQRIPPAPPTTLRLAG